MVNTIKRKVAVTTACVLVLLFILPMGAIAASVNTAGANAPAITFFWVDETNVAPGESVTFSLRTNSVVNYVWAVVDGIRVPATMLDNNTQTGQKSWDLSIRPMASQAVTIYAGLNNSVGGASMIIPITVSGSMVIQPHPMPTVPPRPAPVPRPQPIPSVHTLYSIREIEATARNAVTLEIVTGANSRYVWVRFDNARYRIASLITESGGQRVWQVTYTPNVYRRHMVQVSANHAYVISGATNQNFQVELVAPFVVPVNPLILNASARQSNILVGDSTAITVQTNADVNYVWGMVDGRRVNAHRTGSASNAGNRTWTLNVAPEDSQSIQISASNANSQLADVTRSVNITVNRESASIRSATAQWNAAGTQVQVTVVTNRAAQWVDLQIPGRAAAVTASGRNSGTNEITWTAIFTPSPGWRYVPINVFAGGARAANTGMWGTMGWGDPTETMAVINHIEGYSANELPIIPVQSILSVSQPTIVPTAGGNFDAVFTIITTADVNSVFIRALDTGNFDNAHSVQAGFTNVAQNQRQWTIVLPINGDTASNSTRFEVEAIGARGLLPGGRHLTSNIQFRQEASQ